jgi:GNAT superfamily N-acetyltransferase
MEALQSLKVRPASEADIHHIAKLQINAWQATYCKEPIDIAIHNVFIQTLGKRWLMKFQTGYELLVVETEHGIMGFISFLLSLHHDDAALIDALHVNPPSWRQGVGRLLCETALEKIKKNGFRSVMTWLFEGNKAMETFYQSMGFKNTSIYKSNELGEGIASLEVQYQLSIA